MELEDLIGRWTVEITDIRFPDFPASIPGETTFEWLPGGGYVVVRGTIEHPDFPNTISLLGPQEGTGDLVQHYFDSRGVARVYAMALDGDEWRLWRDAPEISQRFSAVLADGVMRGAWEMAEDGTFVRDFAITYTRS